MVQSNPATSIDLSGKNTLIRAAHHGGHTAAWALYSTDFNHAALTSESETEWFRRNSAESPKAAFKGTTSRRDGTERAVRAIKRVAARVQSSLFSTRLRRLD